MGKSIDFLAHAARMEIDKMKLDVNDGRVCETHPRGRDSMMA
jgi:hypothetical protein